MPRSLPLVLTLATLVLVAPARAQDALAQPPFPPEITDQEWADLPPEQEGEAQWLEDGAAAGPLDGAAAGPLDEGAAAGPYEGEDAQVARMQGTAPAASSGNGGWDNERTVTSKDVGHSGDFGFQQDQAFLSLTMDGGGGLGAADVSWGLRFEGDRFGFLARLGGIVADPDVGGYRLSMVTLEPTWALVAARNLRVRLRGGLVLAGNNDISFGSFSVGASMVLCVLGPLDFEADVTYTPFPFRRVEANAGLALLMGPLSLRTGARTSHVSDLGHQLGGVALTAGYTGAYLGLGLHF